MDAISHDSHLSNQIAEAVLNAYSKLPKKGKPNPQREWTLLAGVVMSITDKSGIKLTTVSLGTGSKCVGKSKMSSKGDILNDSHAEVLARRSFLRFLYEELGNAYYKTSEVFLPPDQELGNRCLLRPNIAFHFFTSHTPCGDASIFPRITNSSHKKIFMSHKLSTNGHVHKTCQDGIESFCSSKSEEHSMVQVTETSGEHSMALSTQGEHSVAEFTETSTENALVQSTETSGENSVILQSTQTSGDSKICKTLTDQICFISAVDLSSQPNNFIHSGVSTYPQNLTQSNVPTYPQNLTQSNVPTYPQNLTQSNVPTYPQNLTQSNVPTYPQKLTQSNVDTYPNNFQRHSDFTNREILPQRSGSTSLTIIPRSNENTDCEIHKAESRKRKYAESNIDSYTDSIDDESDDIGDACMQLRNHAGNPSPSSEAVLKSTDGVEVDIYRTGAKCVPGGRQDPLSPAFNYHRVGLLRTKPGRGERTESMSCSDKMAKWNVLGCQGALLSLFMAEPLHFVSIIVGKCPYSAEAMQRAVISRVCPLSSSLIPPFKVNEPVLSQAHDHDFEASRGQLVQKGQGASQSTNASKIGPSAAAITWCLSSRSDTLNHDVTVNGRRQGITKHDMHKPIARSAVCSNMLFGCFHDLLVKIKPTSIPNVLRSENIKTLTYRQTKSLARDYQTAWAQLRNSVFRTWITKQRELLDYYVND